MLSPEMQRVYLACQKFKDWLEKQPDYVVKSELRLQVQKIFSKVIDNKKLPNDLSITYSAKKHIPLQDIDDALKNIKLQMTGNIKGYLPAMYFLFKLIILKLKDLNEKIN